MRVVEIESCRSLLLCKARNGLLEKGFGMAKFLFTYSGGGGGNSPEEIEAVMAAWGAWFGELGDAVIDIGNPIAKTKVLAADGTITELGDEGPSGYSLIEAADGLVALEMAESCPGLKAGGTVSVSLTLEM